MNCLFIDWLKHNNDLEDDRQRKIDLASEYFHKAYQLHMSGNIREAIDAYKNQLAFILRQKHILFRLGI